jgi:acyl-CoA hydrolase
MDECFIAATVVQKACVTVSSDKIDFTKPIPLQGTIIIEY